MQGSDFIFCLVDRTGSNPNFWKIDANGKAVLSATPYFLDFSPEGWIDLSIQNIRNKKYFGIDRSVTIPFDYVEDGATILKKIAYAYGPEASVYLKVCRLTLDYSAGVNYGFWYKQIYVGEVDLPTFNHKGSKVNVTTLEDGLPKYLKANENTTYELPMDVPDAIYVKMDGISLREKASYTQLSGTDISISNYSKQFFCGGFKVSTEGKSTGMIFNNEDVMGVESLTYAQKLQRPEFIAQAYNNPAALSATITGTIEFTCTSMTSSPAYAVRFRFLRSNLAIGSQNDYEIYSTSALVVGQTYTHSFSITVPLSQDERLYLEGIFFGGPGSDAVIQFTDNSKYTISYKNTYATTYIRALRPQYVYEQLISKVTEGAYLPATVDSITNYFGYNNHYNKVLTCGNAIRGLSDAVMKINFTDFFTFWDCFDAIGISQKVNRISIDRKANLIDFASSISLGDISNLTVGFDKEQLFNELSIGYPEIKNEGGILNGNDEFNCGFLFSLGSVKSPRKIEKIPKIKASCYEIENIRITTANKDSTDYKNDNDNYILHIGNGVNPGAPGGVPVHYDLDRTLNAYVSGLTEPDTVFNIIFSPKRNLIRNGDWIHSLCYKMDTRSLGFKSADKNKNLVTTIGLNIIEEKADMNIGSLDTAFMQPVLLNFDCIPPFELLETLDNNPLQVFDFDIDGSNYTGIMVKSSIAGNGKEQQYTMWSSATNDLTKLIDYYG